MLPATPLENGGGTKLGGDQLFCDTPHTCTCMVNKCGHFKNSISNQKMIIFLKSGGNFAYCHSDTHLSPYKTETLAPKMVSMTHILT